MTLLTQDIQTYKIQIDELLARLHELTQAIKNDELADITDKLRQRMTEPFMFVIVGEVKAGKSSFVNALLDTSHEICKVAPGPMTDTIQQIVYGEKSEWIDINPYLKRNYQNIDLLKDISIVDTPGTNTIVDHHQEITEQFIPAADLIVFVFEAKNPYRQSAWDFFDYIHADWRRKMIFVLQQKDLMTPEDLQVNIDGVKKHAVDKGIKDALVFAVSAKQELDGLKDISGYEPLRQYIIQNITGGQAPRLKIINNISTAQNLLERIQSGLNDRIHQYESDAAFRVSVAESLTNQQELSHRHIDNLIGNLVGKYRKITQDTYQELEDGLSFGTLVKRTFGGLWSKKQNTKNWFNDLTQRLENRLHTEMTARLDNGVNDLAESIQQMARIIDLKLQSNKAVLKSDHQLFSAISEKRSRVLGDLRETFLDFIKDTDNFRGQQYLQETSNVSPNLATGGGIAIIGIILQALSTAAVFDITGGLLTGVGVLFASVSIGWNRRKILQSYRKVVDQSEIEMQNVLTDKLQSYTDDIREKFESTFDQFDEMLKYEKSQLAELEGKTSTLVKDLESMEKKIQTK